jgi:hypothetical protein
MTDYVAFSPEYIYAMAWNLRSNIGSIVSIALYIVLILFCISIIKDILDHLG